MKNGCYNPLRGLDRGLFFETVDSGFRFEKRIDKLSYKRLMCVPGKTVSSLKCSHYNSGVIGVQVTLQNMHWKGGADAPLFQNLTSHAVEGKSYLAVYAG